LGEHIYGLEEVSDGQVGGELAVFSHRQEFEEGMIAIFEFLPSLILTASAANDTIISYLYDKGWR
jgi:hypothetical protein